MSGGEPRKGIFWFICSFDEKDRCDFSETEIISMTVPWNIYGENGDNWNFNSKKGNAFNHKAAWESLVRGRKDIRKYGWNYFPRGRVEIVRGKALIYLNINILQYENFKQDIVETFCLVGLNVRVLVDHSKHYDCHGDDNNIQ